MPYSSYEAVKRWRRRLKERLFQGFGSKCAACGLVDDPICYDFHHIDGQSKDFGVSSNVYKWDAVVAEVLKCIMICSHCHRKIHAGMIDVPKGPMFNESLIDEALFEQKAGGGRRSIPWDDYDLEEMYERHSGNVNRIANEVGTTWKSTHRKLVKLGILDE